MEKIIHICDKCGCEKIYNDSLDSEFRKVKFLIGEKGRTYLPDDSYSSGVVTKTELLLCKECQIKLGICGINNKKEPNFYQQPELIDKIFELFTEIADELDYVRNE
jgi:hypothetical protein